MINRKLLAILLIIFALFTSYTPITNAQASNNSRIVKIAISEDPPKIYTDTDGVVKGFWADLLEHIAEEENWDLEYVNGTFNQALERTERGEVDIMVDIAYSGARSKIYEFTNETTFINWGSVYSKKNVEVESFAELENKTIAALEGDIHYNGPLGVQSLMESFGFEAEYLELSSYEEVLQAVEEDNADFGIVNMLFGITSEQEYNVHRTNLVFNPVELKFAMPKNASDTEYFKSTLDSHINSLKSSPTSVYYDSVIENLEPLFITVEIESDITRTLFIASLSLMALIVLLILMFRRYQKTLRKKVEKKTDELLKSQTRFKEMTDLLPQTVFETDKDGVITYVNQCAEKMFRYTLKRLTSGSFKLQKLFTTLENNDPIAKVLSSKPNSNLIKKELTGFRRDGSRFSTIMYLSQIMDAEHQLIGLRGIITDNTKEKAIHDKLEDRLLEVDSDA